MAQIMANKQYQVKKITNVVNINSGISVVVNTDTLCNVCMVKESKNSFPAMCLVTFPDVHDPKTDDIVTGWIPADKLIGLHDKHGHEVYWVGIEEAAKIIADSFKNNTVRKIYVGNNSTNPEDITDTDSVCGWSAIVRPDLPFDNEENDLVLMMGYLGGGYVGTVYADLSEYDERSFLDDLQTLLCNVTGNDETEDFFLQLIEKDYPGNEDFE